MSGLERHNYDVVVIGACLQEVVTLRDDDRGLSTS
jgi:hypothetical protein